MVNRTDIIIKSKHPTTNKTFTTTITYVNPSASNDKLKALAQAFNGLTNNSLNTITKETKEVII